MYTYILDNSFINFYIITIKLNFNKLLYFEQEKKRKQGE